MWIIFQGAGTKDHILIEILCTRTNDQIAAIASTYKERKLYFFVITSSIVKFPEAMASHNNYIATSIPYMLVYQCNIKQLTEF